MQMVRVRQLHLGLDLLQIRRRHRPFNGCGRPHVHKHRCLNRAMDCPKFAPLRSSIRRQ